jgi:ribosomal protein L14E/L6E/L27E
VTEWGDSIVGGERRKINHTHKRVTIFKNKNERDTPTHTHIHTYTHTHTEQRKRHIYTITAEKVSEEMRERGEERRGEERESSF